MGAPNGSRNVSTKLTESMVLGIRRLGAELDRWGRPAYTAGDIARTYTQDFGVFISTETIRRILRRDTWAWLSEEARDDAGMLAESPMSESERARMEAGKKALLESLHKDGLAMDIAIPEARPVVIIPDAIDPTRDALGQPLSEETKERAAGYGLGKKEE